MVGKISECHVLEREPKSKYLIILNYCWHKDSCMVFAIYWRRQRGRVVRTPGLSPPLTTKLELFFGRLQFDPLVVLLNSQLVGIFRTILCSVDIFVSLSLSGTPVT